MVLLLKNFDLIFCSIYCYTHLYLEKYTSKQKNLLMLICVSSTAFTTFMDLQSAYISAISMIFILTIQLSLFLKQRILLSFVFTLISYAISYTCFSISSIPICLFFTLTEFQYNYLTVQILVFLLQILIIQIPFKFKRTKNSFSFMIKNNRYIPCAVLGFCILIMSIFVNQGILMYLKQYNYVPIYFFTILICAIIFVIYYKHALTKTYLDALTKRNNIDLNNQLEQITRKYDELYADKERLSAIVHSDKKLVNALKNAVMNYLENGNNDNERGKELLEEIERYSKEREGNIQETEKFLNPLPSCNIVVIDNLLAYMYQKAQQNNIELSLMINCDVVAASKDLINLEDFSTLLADLIDNAIIATIHNKGKLILVSFSIVKKHFTIQISDSGIPFTTEVLYTMGKERITTHADDNGNGIGLMQTFETLHKTNASLFIEEYNNPQAIYTKSLSVVFNKKNQTVLYTTRDQMEIAQLYQKSNLIIMKK